VVFNRLVFRVHAIQRVSTHYNGDRSATCYCDGRNGGRYPDDKPYPSRLVLGWNGRRPIHVVVADNLDDQENIVITVYEPDPEEWEPDFKRRKTS